LIYDFFKVKEKSINQLILLLYKTILLYYLLIQKAF